MFDNVLLDTVKVGEHFVEAGIFRLCVFDEVADGPGGGSSVEVAELFARGSFGFAGGAEFDFDAL